MLEGCIPAARAGQPERHLAGGGGGAADMSALQREVFQLREQLAASERELEALRQQSGERCQELAQRELELQRSRLLHFQRAWQAKRLKKELNGRVLELQQNNVELEQLRGDLVQSREKSEILGKELLRAQSAKDFALRGRPSAEQIAEVKAKHAEKLRQYNQAHAEAIQLIYRDVAVEREKNKITIETFEQQLEEKDRLIRALQSHLKETYKTSSTEASRLFQRHTAGGESLDGRQWTQKRGVKTEQVESVPESASNMKRKVRSGRVFE
jgi:chromosome segregation ATPase